VSSFSLALSQSWRRLSRPNVVVTLALALTFALVAALLERQGELGAADRSLTGVSFGLVLPVGLYFLTTRATRNQNLERTFWELARQGADRRQLALGQTALLVSWGIALGTLLGFITVLTARGPWDATLPFDLWASSGVGAFAGAAYACGFTLGSSFGRGGGGRMAFLLLDWVLGRSGSTLALPFPRAHIKNLLGASAPLDLSQGASGAALLGFIFLCLALAIYRIPR